MTNGIRVVQRGTTVDQAADFQVEFDSRWPLLEIYDEINVDVTIMPTAYRSFQVVSPHTLGFPPLYEWIPDESITRFYTIASQGFDYSGRIMVTDKNIMAVAEETYNSNYGANPAGPIHIKGVIRIYKNNPQVAFTSEVLQSVATSAPVDKTLGFKSLRGNNVTGRIDDSEYSEFGVNTNAKALGIHISGAYQEKGTGTSSLAYELVIPHKMGYRPTYWIKQITHWGKSLNYVPDGSGNYYWDGTYVDDAVTDPVIYGQLSLEPVAARAYADTVNIRLDGVQSVLVGDFAILVFHDPVQAAL